MTGGPLFSLNFQATVNEPHIAELVVIALVVMVMTIVISAAYVFSRRRR
jgi:uncharacterized membrane protein (DUF485 family)